MTTHEGIVVSSRSELALTEEQEREGLSAWEHVAVTNDVSKLTNKQRAGVVMLACKRFGLDPLSYPFQFHLIDGRVVMYPSKNAAEQLARKFQVSMRVVRREQVGDLFVCEVEGRMPNGYASFASKYVPVTDERGNRLRGRLLANAYAKAETGAKRRLVLSMVGFGQPDWDEGEGRPVYLDADGSLVERPTQEQRYLLEHPRAARAAGLPTLADTASADDSPVAAPAMTPTEAELTPPPRRSGPPPSFRASAEDVKRWLGAWFAAVDGTRYDTDDARHAFVRTVSGGRTASLREYFETSTAKQAGDLLERIRVEAALERARAAEEPALDDPATWPAEPEDEDD